MSRNYDNWGRLVAATLDRENLRDLARSSSIETSSFRSSFSSSSFDFNVDFAPSMETELSGSVSTLSNSFSNLELQNKPAAGIGVSIELLDDILNRLLEFRNVRMMRPVQLSESEVRMLCIMSREIFLSQPNLLELKAPINICGDIHGQYEDLLRLFALQGFPPDANYLFLGNYVDCGKQSLETMCLLLAYKIKYPENFFLLRGSHECASTNRIYGFCQDCKHRFNVRLWEVFTDCFNCLPVAALIEEKILCMHGGLSPDLTNLDQIRNIPRPTDVPDTGLLCDLLWSDPSTEIKGWGWGMNDRGVSLTFGADKLTEFLKKNDLDLICRSHQVVEDGYEFFADRQLVTIFSAPNYRGEYENVGAWMRVDESLICSFWILKPDDGNRPLQDIVASHSPKPVPVMSQSSPHVSNAPKEKTPPLALDSEVIDVPTIVPPSGTGTTLQVMEDLTHTSSIIPQVVDDPPTIGENPSESMPKIQGSPSGTQVEEMGILPHPNTTTPLNGLSSPLTQVSNEAPREQETPTIIPATTIGHVVPPLEFTVDDRAQENAPLFDPEPEVVQTFDHLCPEWLTPDRPSFQLDEDECNLLRELTTRPLDVLTADDVEKLLDLLIDMERTPDLPQTVTDGLKDAIREASQLELDLSNLSVHASIPSASASLGSKMTSEQEVKEWEQELAAFGLKKKALIADKARVDTELSIAQMQLQEAQAKVTKLENDQGRIDQDLTMLHASVKRRTRAIDRAKSEAERLARRHDLRAQLAQDRIHFLHGRWKKIQGFLENL